MYGVDLHNAKVLSVCWEVASVPSVDRSSERTPVSEGLRSLVGKGYSPSPKGV